MPVTQKQIYEVTMPISLQRMLGEQSYTVTQLKSLQQEILNWGNEISNALGSFDSIAKHTTVVMPSKSKVMLQGSPEQRAKVLEVLQAKHNMTSREVAEKIGVSAQIGSNILRSMFGANLVTRTLNSEVSYREFLYSLPPSDISVA